MTHNSTVSDIQSGRQKVIVLAGFLAVFEGDVCEQVIRFEGGAGAGLAEGDSGVIGSMGGGVQF